MSATFQINLVKYPFHRAVMDIFDCDNLMFLHEKLVPAKGQIPINENDPGFDQNTIFHKQFYKGILENPTFLHLYRSFVKDYFAGPDQNKFLYQKIPTFRVHLPNNKAVGGRSHRDNDYNHPIGETNYLVPLTPMEGTSSVFFESFPGFKDFHFVNLRPGQMWRFNGNRCEHGNLPNTTGYTRVSFDFRTISREDLQKSQVKQSIAYGVKFTEGEYYEAF